MSHRPSALIQRGQTVYWTSTAALVQQLLAAKRDLRLPRELARLDRFACVILDDIGSAQHSRDGNGSAVHRFGRALRAA